MKTARRLASGHLRDGKVVYLACPGMDCRDRAVIVAKNLREIGLHVDIRYGYGQYQLAGVRGTGFDIADVVTRPDYGDPYGIVEKLLDGRVIRAIGNTNLSYYTDPAFSRAVDAAQRLHGAARIRAYEQLDVKVARRSAPLAAYANVNARVFLSRRVGCVTYQPVFGLDIAGLCLRRGEDGQRGEERRSTASSAVPAARSSSARFSASAPATSSRSSRSANEIAAR